MLVAETLALKEEIKAARLLGCKNLIIEEDNFCLINSLNGVWTTPWQIATLLYDVRQDFNTLILFFVVVVFY